MQAAIPRPMDPASISPAALLPKHLRRFVVDQRHDRYTPVDHAAWRYILRQSVRIHGERAHSSYLSGLKATGISLEAIPRIEQMDEILSRIGWGAVAVDGFIPPAAFMEFQAHRVLVIASDMRQLEHLEYTPAPDIVHEAAGHAPIIVDRVYADYLQRIGEYGTKAIPSRHDHDLYEAVRHLSIAKESPGFSPDEIEAAQRAVLELQRDQGAPSEMARLSRLHWWTVEYGLIGTLERPRIYGAGLISSIGEAVSCLGPSVAKLPYGLQAADYAYDITRPQPQLFVTPSFEHLSEVLEQFVETMALRSGGLLGAQRAVESGGTATVEYSSGLQVSGTLCEVIEDAAGEPAYLRTVGPTALALGGRQLDGHGRETHHDGFGSPVGRLRSSQALPSRSRELTRIEFESGVAVSGVVERILYEGQRPLLISLSGCSVKMGDRVLFRPEWGRYDMAVGERGDSVFAGAADKEAYEDTEPVSRERTLRATPGVSAQRRASLYGRVRRIRETSAGYEELGDLWRSVESELASEWLLPLEILELASRRPDQSALAREVRASLERKATAEPKLARLIGDGLALL